MVPKDSKELGWMAGIALPVQWEEGGDGDEAAKEKEEQVIKGYSQHALSISHEWCASLKHIVHEFPTQLHKAYRTIILIWSTKKERDSDLHNLPKVTQVTRN